MHTSPVKAVRLSTKGAASAYRNYKRPATETELNVRWLMEHNHHPVRLTVTDNRGRRAWTNLFDL